MKKSLMIPAEKILDFFVVNMQTAATTRFYQDVAKLCNEENKNNRLLYKKYEINYHFYLFVFISIF